MVQLRENERIDEVNDKLRLIQRTSGLTFGTDALLLAGYMDCRAERGLELGSGTGIISMLLLTRGKLAHATALEVQPTYAELTARNAELNGLSDTLAATEADVREYRTDVPFGVVYTNPPYMKATSGKACREQERGIARHEIAGDISDFVAAAARSLKYGGAFYAVYRPDRLADLIAAMREHRIEPKRLTLVHATAQKAPSMLLIEGRAGGRGGMRVTPPLIIYREDARTYSEDMDHIMEHGSFPDKFRGK